jgi:hypothetical protein
MVAEDLAMVAEDLAMVAEDLRARGLLVFKQSA